MAFARCEIVREFLEQNGIEPERMRLSQAGPYEPQINGESNRMSTKSSRVDVFVLPEYVGDY
jgi:hypothetical protein